MQRSHEQKTMLSLFVKHLDMYQSLKYAKRHMYKIVWPFLDKLWPDTFEASTIVYSWLLPSNYADGLWYTMLIWIPLIKLTLACIHCIIFRLNFFVWYMYYENITNKNKGILFRLWLRRSFSMPMHIFVLIKLKICIHTVFSQYINVKHEMIWFCI